MMTRLKDTLDEFYEQIKTKVEEDLKNLGIMAIYSFTSDHIDSKLFKNDNEMNLFKLSQKEYKGYFDEPLRIVYELDI